MSDSCRQHYQLATGKGLTKAPSSKGSPGFKRGGAVKRNAGGAMYRKGGKAGRK